MQASFSKRRKPVSFTPQSLIRTTSLSPGETFPLVIEPEVCNLTLLSGQRTTVNSSRQSY